MGLPALYVQPTDSDQWDAWSFNHGANHYDIIGATQTSKGITLQTFPLYPMDPSDVELWLYQHQVMHNQANAALGTSGYNLLALDWNDPDQFQLWLELNGDEHVRFCTLLGIG